MLNPRMANVVIGVVTGIWVTNFLAGVILESYEADQMINTIFMAIIGGAFALRGRESRDKDSE